MISRLVIASFRCRTHIHLMLALVLATTCSLLLLARGSLDYQTRRILDSYRAVLESPVDVALYGFFDAEDLEIMNNLPHVAYAERAVQVLATAAGQDLSLAAVPVPSAIWRLRENLVMGDLPTGSASFALSVSRAEEMGLEIGDQVPFHIKYEYEGETREYDTTLRLSGLLRSTPMTVRVPMASLEVVEPLAPTFATVACVLLDDGLNLAEAQLAIKDLKERFPEARIKTFIPGYVVEQGEGSRLARIVGRYCLFLLATVTLLVGTLGSVNLRSRRGEIGTLLSLGVPAEAIIGATVVEAIVDVILGCGLASGLVNTAAVLMKHYRLPDLLNTIDCSPVFLWISVVALVGWLAPLFRLLDRSPMRLMRGRNVV